MRKRRVTGAFSVAFAMVFAMLFLTASFTAAIWPGRAAAAVPRIASVALLRRDSPPQAVSREAGRMLEIRSYHLKPGTRERFHQRFVSESLPLLRRFQVDVVAYGPSLEDADSYFLMRAYASLDDRRRSEDAFYGSDEWRKGPRDAVLADIDTYNTIVIPVDDATLQGLRLAARRQLGPAEKLAQKSGEKLKEQVEKKPKEKMGEELTQKSEKKMTDAQDDAAAVGLLDTQYQEAVKNNDAAAMDRILADDFVLVTGRGTVQTKADLLREAAAGRRVYQHQEDTSRTVRVWGNTAVVTALLWVKGAEGATRFDYKLWFSDVYLRSPAGWRYVFAQASIPLPTTKTQP